MHSIAPKTASANIANAKVRNRQMIGNLSLSLYRLGLVRLGYSGYELWRLRLFSFGGCGLALAALPLVVFALMTTTTLKQYRPAGTNELRKK